MTEEEMSELVSLMRDIGTLANRNPKFTREIHKFAYTISKQYPCNDPACFYCKATTADEFADLVAIASVKTPNRG
jgi:hypothetical protein